MMTTTPHIVVLGAGYTGLTAAKLLAGRTGATVTLVNERDRFVERMRNHQVASGQQVRDLPLRDLLRGTGVRLVVDRVTRIDLSQRHVELLRAPEPIGYDLLINALGSSADLDSVPGAAEHAHAIATVDHARRLRERMRTADSVAVVGAGLTGLEVATELAESYPDRTVRVVTGGPLGAALSERGRDHLHRTFDRLGIQVVEHATAVKVGADGLLLDDGGYVDADTVAWTTGFKVSPLAREAGLAVDDHGRMLVDATLRSQSHPEVYGIGDAAAAYSQDGLQLRMGCGPGGVAGLAAVRAIINRLNGRPAAPLRFRYIGLCISLGRRDGLIQFTEPDDTPRDRIITGRPAAMIKELIVGGAAYGQRRPALAEFTARAF